VAAREESSNIYCGAEAEVIYLYENHATLAT